jgi:hypothetical protein
MAIARKLGTATADSSAIATPSRTGPYGEAIVIPVFQKMNALADEGAYFTATNPTDGTGVAGHAAPVQADAGGKPLLYVYNGGTKTIHFDFLRLRMTAIGAAATTTDFVSYYDTAVRASGGTKITPIPSNGLAGISTSAVVYFGAVLATAVAQKMVDHQRVRSVVSVVEDQYMFSFGSAVVAPPAATVLTGTTVISAYVHFAPLVIPPGYSGGVYQWAASQSGAHSFEFTLGYYER